MGKKMKYAGTLIAVKDIEKSKPFYYDVLGLDVVADFGANDNALREETAKLWTKLNGVPITLEMINCTGCRMEGAKMTFCDKLCPVHNCVREKGLDTCVDCRKIEECPTLRKIAANSPFVLENLKQLRKAIWAHCMKQDNI